MAKCDEAFFVVTGNDSDPDGDAITLIGVSNSGFYGSVSVFDANTVDYFASNHTGTDTVTYTIQDSHGATATGTLTVHVSGAAC